MQNTRPTETPITEAATKHESERADNARKLLYDDRRFWDTNAGNITVSARDGGVMLSGHVMSSNSKLQAEKITNKSTYPPTLQNRLVVDNDLMYLVSQALADNRQTHQEHILVSVRQGVVTLSGRASSAEARQAAEECAAQVPLVRGISNLMGAQGIVVDEREQRVMQPQMGQEVFASDMSLGHVSRLIIDPRNRRVVAIVVRGQFPTRRLMPLRTYPWEIQTQERSVVIPVSTIDSISMSMVQLDIRSVDAAQYTNFQSSDFRQPDAEWHPPYPYTIGDCLWV
jgi:hypothetical protein